MPCAITTKKLRMLGNGAAEKIRIAKAKQLLNQVPLRAQEVGRMCGFDSTSYFCKFREETGRTPLEYRKRHNK